MGDGWKRLDEKQATLSVKLRQFAEGDAERERQPGQHEALGKGW